MGEKWMMQAQYQSAGDNRHTSSDIRIPGEALSGHSNAQVWTRLCQCLREASAAMKLPLRVIGGWPRDLIMTAWHRSRPALSSVPELDIVVEGDARALGRFLQARWSGTLTVYDAFQTATWEVPPDIAGSASSGVHPGADRLSLDLVTARSEIYARPGQLPVVSPGSFADDMARRDFSINTFALDLEAWAQLMAGAHTVPFHHHPQAPADLQARLMRVLHADSFRDDPTRIYRAVRYGQRFDFALEAATQELMLQGIEEGSLDRLSADRIHHELDRIFLEPRAVSILQHMAVLNLLAPSGLEPAMTEARLAACARVSWREPQRPEIFRLLLMAPAGGRRQGAERLRAGLPRHLAVSLDRFGSLIRDPHLCRWPSRPPSWVVQHLHGTAPMVSRTLQAWRPDLKVVLKDYERIWRDFRPRLNGRMLLAMGYAPGPHIGRSLIMVRNACLDGKLETVQEEIAHIQHILGPPLRQSRAGGSTR